MFSGWWALTNVFLFCAEIRGCSLVCTLCRTTITMYLVHETSNRVSRRADSARMESGTLAEPLQEDPEKLSGLQPILQCAPLHLQSGFRTHSHRPRPRAGILLPHAILRLNST